ncbi:hypothetical protein AX14_006096 [Amanita brunnescens Koide BX004]|nr:hypothetical protein AX14_006096 [Amanita brunnescens Koide BX004]
MSSRREQHIIISMEECATGEIYLSTELVGSDIVSYIYSAVKNDPRMRRWSSTIQQHVIDALVVGSNGMFRWVACQIEEVKQCPNQKVLMHTLKHLPESLEIIYDQILQRIDANELPAAKTILQWLVLRMSPLTPKQLSVVVTFDPSSGKFESSLALAHPDDVL